MQQALLYCSENEESPGGGGGILHVKERGTRHFFQGLKTRFCIFYGVQSQKVHSAGVFMVHFEGLR